MKRAMLTLLFLSFFTLCLVAQPQADLEFLPSEESEAEIVFIRDTGAAGWFINFKVFVNDELACRINNRRFSKHLIEEGNHTISIQYFGKKRKQRTRLKALELEPGEKRYVLVIQKVGFWKSTLDLVQVTEADAMLYMKEVKEDGNY